jgi:molecular chaperone GrpE
MDTESSDDKMPKDDDAKQAAGPTDDVAQLKQQLEALQKEKEDLFQKLQRLSADYINYQKRAPRQISDSIAYEKEVIVKSLLPALDNFDQAMTNIEKGMTLDALQKGVQIVYGHLMDILKTHGVETIDSRGKQFDPSLHQAIMQQCQPDRPDGLVIEEYQRGYKLSGRVIRPAKVIVNKLGAAAPAQPEPQEPQMPETPDETTDTQ